MRLSGGNTKTFRGNMRTSEGNKILSGGIIKHQEVTSGLAEITRPDHHNKPTGGLT